MDSSMKALADISFSDWINKESLQSYPIVREHFHLRDVRKLNAPVVEVVCTFDQQNTLADRTMQIMYDPTAFLPVITNSEHSSTNLRIYTAVINLHQSSARIPTQVQLSSPVTLNDACGRRAPFNLEYIDSYKVRICELFGMPYADVINQGFP
jgi:hypothetical protein